MCLSEHTTAAGGGSGVSGSKVWVLGAQRHQLQLNGRCARSVSLVKGDYV